MKETEAITRFCPHVVRFDTCLAGACMEWDSQYTEEEKKIHNVFVIEGLYEDERVKKLVESVPKGFRLGEILKSEEKDGGIYYSIRIIGQKKIQAGRCIFKEPQGVK